MCNATSLYLNIGLIKQFLRDVHWGDVDYLVIDTPPGTSDEHLSVVQYLKDTGITGAIIVTTPQVLALIVWTSSKRIHFLYTNATIQWNKIQINARHSAIESSMCACRKFHCWMLEKKLTSAARSACLSWESWKTWVDLFALSARY